MNSARNNLAGPESLLGMLQRGRGKGYLAALEAAPETVWPLLFECVTNDPRPDRQYEARDEYYASLIIATGMDLEPLRFHLVQNDAANAMHITASAEFASKYAFECLWDCHWDTRRLGCEMAGLSTPGVLERLKEISADANESDDVRQAAQARLEGF